MDDALDGVGLGSPLPLIQMVLPIGISFFTFQAISYVVDVYRRDTPAASLGDVAILQALLPPPRGGADRPRQRAASRSSARRATRARVLAGPALFL